MAFANNPKLVSTPEGVGGIINTQLTGVGTIGFKAGELVYSNAGVATIIGSGAVTGNLVFGQALEDDTTAVGADTKCIVVQPDQIWKIKTTNGATAALASTFTAGTTYGLYVASNVVYADANVTGATYGMVRYIGPAIQAGDATDGSGIYWGLFRFLDSVCEV